MTIKTKASATLGVAKPTTPVKEINVSKAFDFEFLTKRVRDRSLLLKHIEKLNTAKQDPDFLEELNGDLQKDSEPVSSITFQFGSSYQGKYEIVNPSLLNEVTRFLVDAFRAKLDEVESDIESLKS